MGSRRMESTGLEELSLPRESGVPLLGREVV